MPDARRVTAIVFQQSPTQCAIATVTMATGKPYADVLAVGLEGGWYVEGVGCRDVAAILEALGWSSKWEDGEPVGDFVRRHRDYAISPEFFRSIAWGRRAIMTVPSLTNKDGHHSVYWTGSRVLDPNPTDRPRYERFGALLPSAMILFREKGE